MQISPRYDGPPLLLIERELGDPAVPLLRQRRRLGKVLSTFDDEQWATPSRCDGWSAKDVILHLNSTNGFWCASLAQGFAGEPTRYLVGFDPVATPAQLVDGSRHLEPAAVLEAYLEGVEALAELVTELDAERWATMAEAPPGHIAASAVVLHALWDAWVHERDILLPLGIAADEEPDELVASLTYAVALGPAFRASWGDERTGTAVFAVAEPDVSLVVDLGPTVVVRENADAPADAVRVEGAAVDLLEALSYRAPLAAAIPDAQRWMFDGLGEVFEQA